MNGDALLNVLVAISNLPGDPKWNAGMAKMYEVGLRFIPNEDADLVFEALIDSFDFRPSVRQVRELHRTITQGPRRSAAEIVGEILDYRSRFGAAGAVLPGFESRYPNITTWGMPRDMSEEAKAAVKCLGGWIEFCEDKSPRGVQLGQLTKAAQAIVDGAQTPVLAALNQQYQARQVPALPDASADADVIEGEFTNETARIGGMNSFGDMSRRLIGAGR